LKSDVCWFYSHSVKLLFSLIDNGYSDHENLTHLKGAFVQSSNIQYHVVDWAQNVWEQATPSVWTLRRTRFWHHCDQAIGWLHQRQRSYKQAGVIQRLSENQAHQRVRQYSKNWDYPHEAKLIDVTYGGISQVLGSVDLQIAQWISEDFGVKEISMWIDKLKANDPVMSADYTSLEHLVPLHSIFRSSRCTQETGTRYRWYPMCHISSEIDLVTNDEVIEIKFSEYSHALGQFLTFQVSTREKPRVHFFWDGGGLWGRFIWSISEICTRFQREITYEVISSPSLANSKRIVSCLRTILCDTCRKRFSLN
jgi:hypothetical protein